MKRDRQFEFIKDSRFSDNPQGELNKMTKELEQNIVDLGILTVFPTRVLDFNDGTISFRKTFRIEKRKGFSWNNLYTVINKIQAPYYNIV